MELEIQPDLNPQPLTFNELVTDCRVIPSKSLYVSHFLSTWNTRGFDFGSVLFLATIYPGTLLPMSIYALGRAASAILFSHRVGHYIDTQERLSVVRLSIVGQRMAVVFSCIIFLILLVMDVSSILSKVVLGVLILLACIEKLCSIMNMVAIERDWVVVIANKDENLLQELNSQMRRIDLFCKLVAPLAIALVDGTSTKIALFVTMILNICSVVIEYSFIARVYQNIPALARPWSRFNDAESVVSASQCATPEPQVMERTVSDRNLSYMDGTVFAALKTYVHSSAFLPSLALSMLYLTVLSFSGQMTTFLLAVPRPKMNSTIVGLVRTGAIALEISATFIAPQIMAAIGPVRAGIWCLSWQLLCLTSAVGLLWSYKGSSSASQIIGFVTAVVLSRTGLWSFDLVAQLLIQNSVDSSHRGSFSSAEASLQNFFQLCTFALTIIFPRPDQFKYPALVSLGAVYCAAALYAKFVRDRRGHLIHLPDCLKHVGGGSYEMVNQGNDQP